MNWSPLIGIGGEMSPEGQRKISPQGDLRVRLLEVGCELECAREALQLPAGGRAALRSLPYSDMKARLLVALIVVIGDTQNVLRALRQIVLLPLAHRAVPHRQRYLR